MPRAADYDTGRPTTVDKPVIPSEDYQELYDTIRQNEERDPDFYKDPNPPVTLSDPMPVYMTVNEVREQALEDLREGMEELDEQIDAISRSLRKKKKGKRA